MEKLTYVNIDDLKIGDTVGFCKYIDYGWNLHFRYPIVTKKIIKRITPKRTKFVLDGDIELDIERAKRLVIFNDVAEQQTKVAKIFNKLKHIQYELNQAERKGNYVIEKKISDEELVEYCTFLKNMCDKYLNEEEKK